MPKSSKHKLKAEENIKVSKDWLKPKIMLSLQEYQVDLLMLALASFKPRNPEEKDDTNLLQKILLHNLQEQLKDTTTASDQEQK